MSIAGRLEQNSFVQQTLNFRLLKRVGQFSIRNGHLIISLEGRKQQTIVECQTNARASQIL